MNWFSWWQDKQKWKLICVLFFSVRWVHKVKQYQSSTLNFRNLSFKFRWEDIWFLLLLKRSWTEHITFILSFAIVNLRTKRRKSQRFINSQKASAMQFFTWREFLTRGRRFRTKKLPPCDLSVITPLLFPTFSSSL